MNEWLPTKAKNEIYKPILAFIVQCLEEQWPDKYERHTNLDIRYELCEYQRQLQCWYLDGEVRHRPTKYEAVTLLHATTLRSAFITSMEGCLELQ